MEDIRTIDNSAPDILSGMTDDATKENTRLLPAEVKGSASAELYASGLKEKPGEKHFFIPVEDTFDAIHGKKEYDNAAIALQINVIR